MRRSVASYITRRVLINFPLAIFIISLAGVAITTVAAALGMTFHDYLPVPFYDEWDELSRWEAVKKDSFFEVLFSQHNEHRIALPRVIFFSDLRWFHGTGLLTLTILFLVQLGHAIFLAKLVNKSLEYQSWQAIAVTSVIVAIMFSVLQFDNLKTPFQLQFVGVFALASWGFFYLFPTDVAAYSPRARKKEIICFIGGLCLCMAATLTMSNGLLTWPVAFFAGLIGRLSMRKLTIIAITGISVWATYFHDFQFPPGHSHPSDTINTLWPIIEYVSIYLGHPLSPHWPEYASAVGLAGIALAMILFSTALMDHKRNIFKDRYSTSLTLIVMFILGTAIATALGRVDFGLTQAASGRYATPALVFWLAMCANCVVAYQAAKRYRLFWLVGGTFLGTLMVSSVIVNQSNFWDLRGDWRNTKKQAATAILAKVYDEDVFWRLHPHPWNIFEKARVLEHDSLGIYSLWFSALPGETLSKIFTLVNSDRCAGHLDTVREISSDRTGYRTSGWAIDQASKKPPRLVLFAAGETITGLAFPGASRPDVEKLFPTVSDAGWRGHAKLGADETLRAYAVLEDGRSICQLKGEYIPSARS